MKIHDISLSCASPDSRYPAEAVEWPGDVPFARTVRAEVETDGLEGSEFTASAHSGTHLDFPAHFIPGGWHLGDYPASRFFPPAVVIDCSGLDAGIREIDPAHFDADAIRPGDAVLFKTRNSTSGLNRTGEFTRDFTAISPETAALLIRRGVSVAGIDCWSIERDDRPDYPVHKALLSEDVLILENVTLHDITPGRYRLACAPAKFGELEASPVRAVLIEGLPE